MSRTGDRSSPLRFVKKVGDRGTLTLPLEVREAMGIEPGDLVILDVVEVVKHVELQGHFRSRREENLPQDGDVQSAERPT